MPASSSIAEKVELHSIADRIEIAPRVMMPRLGLGTWRAGGRELREAISIAFGLGYRLLDTAANYRNEEDIAQVLSVAGLPREELFVTTKLEEPDQGSRSTPRALEASLRRLRLDYVDLYLIHWPQPSVTAQTWRALEKLVDRGLTRAIGVSNFGIRDLDQVFSAGHMPPAVNQVELHPLRQITSLQEYCDERGITIQAWRPVLYGRTGDVPVLAEIGRRHSKTAAQVSIRWILQKGMTTIPKSVHEEHLRENADVFDFELSDDEMASIDRLDRGEHVRW